MAEGQVERELGYKCKICGYKWSVYEEDPKKCPKCNNSNIKVVFRSCKGKG